MDLAIKYRPKTLDDVIGQPQAVTIMKKWKTPPQCVLFHGQTGAGKSTLAGIYADMIGATSKNGNLYEIDTATANGVQHIREIADRMQFVGLGKRTNGKEPARCWLWNEAHLMTSEAQSALLMPTETPPKHVHFVFCTTNPSKMLPTLRNRCTQIEIKRISDADLKTLALRVVQAEKPQHLLQSKVIDELIKVADGCARQLLKDLEKVLPLAKESDRLEAITAIQAEKKGVDLARLLMKRPAWVECAKLIKEITEEPETIRRVVIAYASSVLLSGRRDKIAESIIESFFDNFYDSRMGGLIVACLPLCR